jgi:hypothetical protein
MREIRLLTRISTGRAGSAYGDAVTLGSGSNGPVGVQATKATAARNVAVPDVRVRFWVPPIVGLPNEGVRVGCQACGLALTKCRSRHGRATTALGK